MNLDLLEEWLHEFQHPIGLIELYAIVVAYKLWGNSFLRRRVILFGDSWAANDVFVKGTSSIRAWRCRFLELEKLDEKHEALAWMARVYHLHRISQIPQAGAPSQNSNLFAFML